MKRWIAIAAILILGACILIPKPGFTEDRDTVLLARTIYALARNDSYDAKLAIGTVAMNRVDNPWFSDTLGDVLNEQHQFPIGSRYDSESLSAAHAVLSGRRNLGAEALYYQSADASAPRSDKPLTTVGKFAFYATEDL
ncbi:MAG: cell wall hydrolase [Clostridia bacterium]|nr:cell wall hydrolase [Clostridia bacterium]